MARYPFRRIAADGNGNILPTATITVYLEGTTTLATIYPLSTGAASSDGTVTSDATNGSFVFWVDTTDYAQTQRFKIAISKSGFNTQSFDNIMVFPGSASSSLTDYSVTATATGANTNETTLATLTITAGAMNSEGAVARITAWGATAANSNNKTIQVKFGSTVLVTTSAQSWNGKKWRAEATVMCVTANTQIANGKVYTVAATAMDNTAPTEDLTGAVSITILGTNGTASASDITFTGAILEVIT